VKGKSSRFVGVRLTKDDQSNLQAILGSGLADNITDAIRFGLYLAAKAATRWVSRKK
jgi:hypothetical protein